MKRMEDSAPKRVRIMDNLRGLTDSSDEGSEDADVTEMRMDFEVNLGPNSVRNQENGVVIL